MSLPCSYIHMTLKPSGTHESNLLFRDIQNEVMFKADIYSYFFIEYVSSYDYAYVISV